MAFDVRLLLDIALLLFFAKLFGEVTERLKLSSLIGEIFGGVLVGPMLGWVHPTDPLTQIATLGILFLLFLIGLETKIEEIRNDTYTGSYLAIIGCGLSFLAGIAIGLLLFRSLDIGIFLGIAIISTSTAITLRALADIGEFKSRVYKLSLAIDMADEVIAIMALTMLTSYFAYGGIQPFQVFTLLLVVIGFFFLITTAGSRYVNRFLSLFQMFHDEQMLVAIPIAIVFVIAFLSEHIGVAGVTGAFLAGMAMSRSPLAHPVILPKIKVIGYGLLIPLFFAYSALILNLQSLAASWQLIALLVVFGSAAKVLGTGIAARLWNYDLREQLLVGIGMIPHGEYSIVISQIALTAGIITGDIYTAIIAFVMITILITPLLLRLVAGKRFHRW